MLFKKIAESVKQPISFTRLANIVSSTGIKVSKSTVITYTGYAKDTWLVTAVQNIAGKLVDKETNPKYYFTDNGILNIFLLDPETALLENMVAVNLLRKYGVIEHLIVVVGGNPDSVPCLIKCRNVSRSYLVSNVRY